MLLNEKALLSSFKNYPLINLIFLEWRSIRKFFKEAIENIKINFEVKIIQ